MAAEEIHNFSVVNADINIIKDFAYLGSVITSHGGCHQEIKSRLRLGGQQRKH